MRKKSWPEYSTCCAGIKKNYKNQNLLILFYVGEKRLPSTAIQNYYKIMK